jgi:hypothetical protein
MFRASLQSDGKSWIDGDLSGLSRTALKSDLAYQPAELKLLKTPFQGTLYSVHAFHRLDCVLFADERRNRQELLWLSCPVGIQLEQSQMVGVPGLQRADQEFELGKHA